MKRTSASLVCAVLLFGAPRSARADSSLGASPCTADAPLIALASASHSAQRVEEGIQWDARFIMTLEASSDFQGGRVALAAPLSSLETLRAASPAYVSPLVEADRIVGFCFQKEAQDSMLTPWSLAGRTLTVSLTQPVAHSGDRAFRVGIPLAAGSIVQVIDPSLTFGRRIELLDPLVERHMTYVAPRSMSRGEREEAERLTSTKATFAKQPIYLRGDDVHTRDGIEGRLTEPPKVNGHRTALGAAAVFATIVGALGIAARRLRRSAMLERADALLAREIDDLSAQAPRDAKGLR